VLSKLSKFRNGEKCNGHFLGKVPENPEIIEFPKSEPFGRKIKWNGISMDKNSENLGIQQEVFSALWPR